MDLDKSILKPDIPIPPRVHTLAIFGVVPFPAVPPTVDNFPTGKTFHSLSYVLNVSFAFILIAEDVCTIQEVVVRRTVGRVIPEDLREWGT